MLTDEQRAEIARRYQAREPLKNIAADLNVCTTTASKVARMLGCEGRHGPRRRLKVDMRPAEYDALRRYAKGQRAKPETLAREAIAASLGLTQ